MEILHELIPNIPISIYGTKIRGAGEDMSFDINDTSDRGEGRKKILWAFREMPVLGSIREIFRKKMPLRNINISACLHITSETANLAITLKEGGARVSLCASNPLSTSDPVAHSLARDHEISVFAIHGEDRETYYRHLHQALDVPPHITMDDGGDLISMIHTERRELLDSVLGGTEETTTGVHRFKNMERENVLEYPIIAVNDAQTKYLFDNRYGTGQSTIDGIIRATNILLAGKLFVVAGYGWCGRGVAMRAKAMGAHVMVTEVDAIRALEAVMDGFTVTSMDKAVLKGDIFVTTTGNTSIIRTEHFRNMKDGAIMANSGHFNVEIDIAGLEKRAVRKNVIRDHIEEYELQDGRKLYVLGQGRLVNLAAAEGHPASVMDMSFANQALSAEHIVKNHGELDKRVYTVPERIDRTIARLKLASMNVEIDELSEEQKNYMNSWQQGT